MPPANGQLPATVTHAADAGEPSRDRSIPTTPFGSIPIFRSERRFGSLKRS